MPCSRDVEKAILDKVFDELTDRRYTFTRVMDDTVQINGVVDNPRTKATRRDISKAIAKELVERTKQSFQGQVRGTINDRSVYDPITVTFSVNPAYTQYEFNKLINPTIGDNTLLSASLNDEEERDDVNNNTGPNNRDNNNDNIFAGITEKYIQHKTIQLGNYKEQLGIIKGQKKVVGISKERLEALNKKERELKLLISGNEEIGVKGLEDELEEMRTKAKPVSYYMEKDLDRLNELSKSNKIEDITEANRIIQFIENSGKFDSSNTNPFFDRDDIFETNEDGEYTSTYKIDEDTRNAFGKWATKAVGFKNIVEEREKELSEININDNPLIKQTYGDKKQKYKDVFHTEEGLRDTDWFSMWFLDPTHGLASHNGLIPQVAMSNLIEATEAKERWSREMSDYIDNNEAAIKKELIRLGHDVNKLGITGVKSASFNLFKRVSKEGNESHDLVQRETKEYADERSRKLYIFDKAFKRAMSYTDYEQRNKGISKAFEELKKWRRESSIMVDPSRLTDEDYKKKLINLLGEKGYNEVVVEQEKAITNYNSYRQSSIETLLARENVNSYDELSDKAKNSIKEWEVSYSPENGYKDYNSVGGLYFGDKKRGHFNTYNIFIPRKFKAEIAANIDEDRYSITDTKQETGNWDKNFEEIQSSPILADFYSKLKEFCEVIYENLPYDLQERTSMYTLPGIMKTTAEIVNSNTETTGMLSRVSKAYQTIMDRFRTSFGVVKQGNISYLTEDPVTGKKNYKVNDSFLRNNSRAIDDRKLIENTKFLQAFNSDKLVPLDKIKKSTSLLLSQFNTSCLIQLAQYLHVDVAGQLQMSNVDAIRAKLDKTSDGNDYIVDIGRLIHDFSVHSVVQSQSFDLPKLMKYFSEMTMAYAARREALPINEILKKHYNRIQSPDTNNVGETLWNRITGKKGQEVAKVGVRTGAMRQFDNWFERVLLDNYGSKHVGVYGKENGPNGKIPFLGKTIYTTEERQKYNELQELIREEENDKTRKELINTRDSLGKTRTATAAIDNFLNWIRTLRLGYNLSSMATNFLQGVTSNMILGASDEYFDPKELFYGYRVMKWSFAKNITFGYLEHPLAKKNRSLVEKFNIIIDNRNELQKSYSNKILNAANPYAGNQRVEYMNQSPLMIAVLRTLKIKDKAGNESSVWDAYNSDGHLKDEFQTPENTKNWEALDGDQYKAFKQKVNGLITLGHGNYDKLRGMMVKSNSMGKAGMMFKTWLPEAVYWRFGNPQDNIFLGKQGTKGIYRSHNPGSGLVHGAVVGAAMFGPVGSLIGGALGLGAAAGFGTSSGVGLLKETLEATRLLVKKAIGMPVNLITGKQIINLHQKQFFGKGEYFDYVGKGQKFTIQDSKNLQANMADIGLQLMWLGLILAVKHFFWDDDDDPQDNERIAHNILMNNLMNLGSQASMYTNPVAFKANTIESIAVIDYLKQVGKEADKVQNWFNGQDIIQSGSDAGHSALAIQSKKILLPGIFKDTRLGFKAAGERVYPQESPYHKYFHNEEHDEKDSNKRARAERRAELLESDEYKDMNKLSDDEQKEKKKAIQKIIDEELPTPSMIKKQKEKE